MSMPSNPSGICPPQVWLPPRGPPAPRAGLHVFETGPELVVHLAFFFVVQDVERRLDFLKLLLRLLVVGVEVGVILAGQIAVGLLNFGRRGFRFTPRVW